ncbi:hypothetical protein Y032_0080g1344 [Ancylostoma ceylanicum]|uniref:CC domain-containing protein n=1 Tax=Ancylostoma ceylanicum TaxID=53326 RepID=A0A016TSI8_9BILA|nr:hypothetical protein Y032_0080g1344 [Ancylostoma ceylanicum]
MLLIALTTVLTFVSGELSQSNGELQTRPRRQNSYTFYYLCGRYPNQYISYYPCPCTNCQPSCQYRCSTTMYCQTININWVCKNGCCAENAYTPYPPITTTTATPTIRPNPLCEGREASAGYCQAGGSCPSGFLCTSNNVCCRCAYGTSIGPCVNSQCPDNFQCNMNNECCPYQVGR